MNTHIACANEDTAAVQYTFGVVEAVAVVVAAVADASLIAVHVAA